MKAATFAIAIAITGLVASAALAAPSSTMYTGHELAGTAKISLATARAFALKAHAGRITDQELEREAGGSGLRYSFDIASRGKTIEVGIDAMTGAVLENAVETKKMEAAETRADKKAMAARQPM